MRKCLIIFFSILFFFTKGQDVHFSQFTRTSFLLNPSLISFQKNDYKAILQRRSQWKSVTVPFNTFTVSIERKNVYSSHSCGVQFLNDVAGDSRFRTTGFNFLYAKSFSASNRNNLSFGGLVGFFQRDITYSNLIFNQQENQSDFNFWFPDLSLGLSNNYKIEESVYLISGISVYHLNKPKQSLTQNKNIRLNNKFNFYSSLSYLWKKRVLLTPSIFYSYKKQSKKRQ